MSTDGKEVVIMLSKLFKLVKYTAMGVVGFVVIIMCVGIFGTPHKSSTTTNNATKVETSKPEPVAETSTTNEPQEEIKREENKPDESISDKAKSLASEASDYVAEKVDELEGPYNSDGTVKLDKYPPGSILPTEDRKIAGIVTQDSADTFEYMIFDTYSGTTVKVTHYPRMGKYSTEITMSDEKEQVLLAQLAKQESVAHGIQSKFSGAATVSGIKVINEKDLDSSGCDWFYSVNITGTSFGSYSGKTARIVDTMKSNPNNPKKSLRLVDSSL